MKRDNLRLYSLLMRVRPAQAAEALKRALRIRRRVVHTAVGASFWVDPVSVFGLQLLREGIYEPQLTRLVQFVLRDGDVFVDIGANEGYFSVLGSFLVGSGRVHAVEPQARLGVIIERNMRLNNAASVVVHRLALSDRAGDTDLFLRPSTNTGASSMFRHWRLGWARERVQTTTLDAFFAALGLERVRLVKLDTEGAEAAIVEGGEQILRRRGVEFLAIEYHPQIIGRRACLQAHQKLRASGYVLTRAGGLGVYHLPGLEHHLSPLGALELDCSWGE